MGVIINQEVEVSWAYRSKTYYINLGIPFTSIGDIFKVPYNKLPSNANVQVLIECDMCGTHIFKGLQGLRDRQTTYCSTSCAHESKKRRISFKCDSCGKEGEKTQYQFNKHIHHFCNSECSANFDRSYIPKVQCVCEQCTKNYEVEQSQYNRYGSKFCSVKCRNQWESINKRGFNHHRYKRIPKQCSHCNTKIDVPRYKVTNDSRHFCDTSCRQQWYAEVWSQQPEWREKSAKRAIDMLSNGSFNHTNTSCQKVVNEILDEMSINYENEFPCTYYTVDNYLIDHHLMIEVMGSFWHCDPRVYEGVNHDIQANRIIKDATKKKYILGKYGIKILYLWEKDIHENPMLCQKLVQHYIGNSGNIDNYHSYNYDIVENNLNLKDDIMSPFFELKVNK
ncbi:hypothetical protein ACH6EH_06565 [Paenibacillus sp. JSM ZJ436]|uniref:hypothetical protein n=1 Tax=Paenibacillus sp. JSM ZJ436 TaxID=3376190 RepID=UPI00378868E7